MKNQFITALVPMKANSERLPNKNIRKFAGKPLYRIILDKLLQSNFINEIIINTDIESVLNLSDVDKKLKIIERPKNLRGDFVPFFDIIEHDLKLTKSNLFIHTHSTNPLLKTETIDKAILTYIHNRNYDSLLSVNRLKKRTYYSDYKPINHDPYDKLLRTQDLKPIFVDCSCIYIFSRESFRSSGNHRIGKKPYFFEVDEIESIDIDYENDFLLAENIYKYQIAL